MLASAAYMMVAGATEIYAGPTNLIGSVGVITHLEDSSAKFENEGVKVIPVMTGLHKTTGEPGVPISDEQIDQVQSLVNGTMAIFREQMRVSRGLSAEVMNEIADGSLYLAADALRLGLIDGIRNLGTALESINQAPQGRSTRLARVAIANLQI